LPTLIEETEIRLTWDDIDNRVIHPSEKRQRSPGIHLMSGVLKPVLLASRILKPIDREQLSLDEMPLNMAIGMAVEDWFMGLWPHMHAHPGEVRLDGVIGSPDGRSLGKWVSDKVPRKAGVLEECKATWCSRRTYGQNVLEHLVWLWQISGYCHMLGLEWARLQVMWINGPYNQGPPKPEYFTYLIKFERQELADFWDAIILNNLEGATAE